VIEVQGACRGGYLVKQAKAH